MLARYKGVCKRCGSAYPAGAEVWYDRTTKKVLSCPACESRGKPPPPVLLTRDELRVRVESLQSENAQLKKERDEALKNALPPPKPPGYEVIKLCDMIHIKCPRCSSETRVPWSKTYENQHRNICITCPICETNWTLAQCRVKEPT